MSDYWVKIEAKDTIRIFEYNRQGKQWEQEVKIAECCMCFETKKDLVGRWRSGVPIAVCLDCLKELNAIAKQAGEKKNVGE